jgi:hypothetical protein
MTPEPRTHSSLWSNRSASSDHDQRSQRDESRPGADNSAFTPASAQSASPAAWEAEPSRPAFPTVRRGLDAAAVEAHIARLDASMAELRAALEDSERRRTMAEQHAVAVEEEIRVVRSGLQATPAPEAGFGARAERMLRLAETEAEQIRTAANRSAAEVTERSRGEAERHRHDVQQRLIAESSRAEEHARRRADELQERETALRARLSDAHAEAEAIRTAAEHSANTQRQTAQADIDELRGRAVRDLARNREREERELARLRDLQGAARHELTRLVAAIRAELPASAARPSPGPGRRSGRDVGGNRVLDGGETGSGGGGPPQRTYAEVATATP